MPNWSIKISNVVIINLKFHLLSCYELFAAARPQKEKYLSDTCKRLANPEVHSVPIWNIF